MAVRLCARAHKSLRDHGNVLIIFSSEEKKMDIVQAELYLPLY
jgi:hypothetical protein